MKKFQRFSENSFSALDGEEENAEKEKSMLRKLTKQMQQTNKEINLFSRSLQSENQKREKFKRNREVNEVVDKLISTSSKPKIHDERVKDVVSKALAEIEIANKNEEGETSDYVTNTSSSNSQYKHSKSNDADSQSDLQAKLLFNSEPLSSAPKFKHDNPAVPRSEVYTKIKNPSKNNKNFNDSSFKFDDKINSDLSRMQKEKSRQLLKKKSKTSNPTRSHSFIRIPLQTEIRRHNLIKRFKRKVNKLNKQLNSFYGQKKISIDIGCQTDIQIEKNQSSISNATTEPKNEIEQQIDEQKLITTEGIADDEDFSILSPIIGDEVRYSDSSAKDNLLSQENPDFHSTFVKPSTTSRQNSYPIQKETEYLSETCLDSSSFTLSQFSSTSTKNQTLLDQNISPSALNESHLQSQQPFDRLSTHSPSTHSSLNSNLSNITSSSDSSAASDLSENASKIPSQTDFFQQQQMLPKHMAPIHVSSDVIATPLQLPRPTNNKASSPSSQLSPSSSSFSVSQKELKAQLPSPSFFNIHLTPLPPPPPPPPFNLSYFTSTSLPDKKYTDYFPFQQKISIESSPSSMKIASDSSHDNIEPLPTTKLNTQNFNTRKIYTDTSFSASTYSPSHSVENTPNNLSNENTLNKTKHSAPVNHLLYPLDTPPSEMIKRDLSKKAHHQNTSSLIRSSFQTLHKERTNTGTPMVDSSLPEQKQRRTRESISEQEEQKSFVDINESDDIASVEREIDKGFADYENEDELFFESKEKRKYRKSNPQSMQKEADIFNEKGKDFSSYEVKERITDSNRKKKQAEAEKLLWQKWKEKEDAYWDSQFAGGSFL